MNKITINKVGYNSLYDFIGETFLKNLYNVKDFHDASIAEGLNYKQYLFYPIIKKNDNLIISLYNSKNVDEEKTEYKKPLQEIKYSDLVCYKKAKVLPLYISKKNEVEKSKSIDDLNEDIPDDYKPKINRSDELKREEDVRKKREEIRKRDEESRKRDEESRKREQEEIKKREQEELRKREEEIRKREELERLRKIEEKLQEDREMLRKNREEEEERNDTEDIEKRKKVKIKKNVTKDVINDKKNIEIIDKKEKEIYKPINEESLIDKFKKIRKENGVNIPMDQCVIDTLKSITETNMVELRSFNKIIDSINKCSGMLIS